jgi:hypothetical protein
MQKTSRIANEHEKSAKGGSFAEPEGYFYSVPGEAPLDAAVGGGAVR